MPKVRKVGQFTAPAKQSDTTTTATNKSRGQRKRQAKRDQYLKRQELVLSTLRLEQYELDQKKRIDGLDALKEALKVVEDTPSSRRVDNNNKTHTHLLSTNKSKRQLVAREVPHLSLVLEHPKFQSNPFATIQEHLKNTLQKQAQELQEEGKERAKQDAKKQEQTKLAKKERLRERGGKKRNKYHAARRSRK